MASEANQGIGLTLKLPAIRILGTAKSSGQEYESPKTED
jgi:hypothetical protein